MKDRKGVIVKVFGLYSTVLYEGERINCVLRGKMRMNKNTERYSNPLAVGDRVLFSLQNDGCGVISKVMERENIFSRKEKGKNKKEDVIAANLDQIIVIMSFKKPKLNLRFMDRIYVRGASGGIPVHLCINKVDLAQKDMITDVKEYYKDTDVELSIVSAHTGYGMDDFRALIHGHVSLLVGNSGVGKTSLLKYLYPDLDLRIRDVSESTGKGRHTTTNVEMVYYADGTSIIDTPGLREFGLMDIDPNLMGNLYYEYGRLGEKCSFSPCTHDHEPGCEIKKRVEKGRMNSDRYISYLNILYSLKESHNRKYK